MKKVIILLAVAAISGGCSKAPTDSPLSATHESALLVNYHIRDYGLLYDLSDGSFDTLHFVESAIPRRTAINRQAEEIYVSAAPALHDERTYVYDLNTRSHKVTLPYEAGQGVYPSPDGRYLALSGLSIRILSTSDYSVVHVDTLNVASKAGCWSADGSRYFCYIAGAAGPQGIYSLDLNATPLVFELVWSGVTFDFRVSNDQSELYILNSVDGRFEIWSRTDDSVLYRSELDEFDQYDPHLGEVELSPDGRTAFVAIERYTAIPWSLGEPTTVIHVFDVANRGKLADIDLDAAPVDSLQAPLDVYSMALQANGTRLVAVSSVGSFGAHLFDYDLSEGDFERTVPLVYANPAWVID